MKSSDTAKSRMYASLAAGGMTLGQAAQLCGGELIINGSADPDIRITGVSTDSRDACEGMLFVAVKGDRFDGHDFAAKALSDGASAALVSRVPDGLPENCALILADDTVIALGKLATAYKAQLAPLTVAVTGSVGKTTTREYISAVLARRYKTHTTTDNLNSEIGLPIVLLKTGADDKALVAEMGMQGLGEISYLSRMAQPDIAVITNIGTSHIGLLGSRENIAKAKLEIRDGLRGGGILILNGHEPLIAGIDGAVYVSPSAEDTDADFRITEYKTDPTGTKGIFTLTAKDGRDYKDIVIPTLGEHTALDASYAFVVGLSAGMDEAQIRAGLCDYVPVAMRQNIYDWSGTLIIEDCYNAAPESVAASLKVLSGLAEARGLRRCAVLGDMLELGDRAEELHVKTGRAAKDSGIQLLIAVGEMADKLAEGAEGVTEIITAADAGEAGKLMREYISSGDAVLVKGSRGVGLEKALEIFKS